jgi:hypothetical protein
MQARQMQVEFERLIQLINPDYLISKKIDSDTIFYFLNAAQDRYIKSNYLAIDNTRGSLENLKKNTDAFKSLIVTRDLGPGVNISGNYMFGKKYELPTDETNEYFLYLRSSSKVFGTYMGILEDNATWVPNKFTTQDEVDNVLTSYFNKPILRQPCAILEATEENGSYLAIYTDSYTTVTRAECTYIRKPRPITVQGIPQDCELSTNVHQEIVELAVTIFIQEAAYRLGMSDTRKQKD